MKKMYFFALFILISMAGTAQQADTIPVYIVVEDTARMHETYYNIPAVDTDTSEVMPSDNWQEVVSGYIVDDGVNALVYLDMFYKPLEKKYKITAYSFK